MTTSSEAELSSLARGLVGSEILKIAGEIRSMIADGREVCNLTVGDFSPKEFRIPAELERLIHEALSAGETNYPPSDGMLELRRAVVAFTKERLGLDYGIDSILIAGGSRPIIYAAYAAIVDPGDKVIYPTPSWNNNHYTYLMRGTPVEVPVGPETNFLPNADMLRPHIGDARLLFITTPLNPAGTVMSRAEVEAIGQMVLEENRRREGTGQRPLFLLWDQVYWTLTFGENRHDSPAQLVPEVSRYVIHVDGISKAFASTGVRVGWTMAPPHVAARMRDILGHIGAWAPRAEQLATAKFLANTAAVDSFHEEMIRGLRERLDALHDGFEVMRADGLPVRAFEPQGAIYLSVQFDLIGKGFGTNEEIRRFLLDRAGFAVVPFQAFGVKKDDGWFRLSVGAVSMDEIRAGLDRVRLALAAIPQQATR